MARVGGVDPEHSLAAAATSAAVRRRAAEHPEPEPPTPRRGHRLLYGFAALAVLALAALAAVLITDVGTRKEDRQLADLLYYALMGGACVAVMARVAIRPQQRLAWGLIGAGLVAWIAGDLYYSIVLAGSGSIPYPSLSDAGYLFLYIGAFAGLTILGARGRSKGSWALMTVVAGLATLWSWLVFSHVVAVASGETAAVATTLAYPLGDLVLLISALLLLVAAGPGSTGRPRRSPSGSR